MADVQQMAAKVADLLESRLRVRGPTLAVLVRKAGRRLPRKVRRAAQELASFEGLARHPKGAMMVSQGRAEAAYEICMNHLRPLGSKERFVSAALNFAGTIALMLLVLGGVFLAIWAFRGPF
ncbi:hypothetical protein [Falsigemmobacter faecalis]|nr:hypothetical protein [Falsigemmobacter faecalis]